MYVFRLLGRQVERHTYTTYIYVRIDVYICIYVCVCNFGNMSFWKLLYVFHEYKINTQILNSCPGNAFSNLNIMEKHEVERCEVESRIHL